MTPRPSKTHILKILDKFFFKYIYICMSYVCIEKKKHIYIYIYCVSCHSLTQPGSTKFISDKINLIKKQKKTTTTNKYLLKHFFLSNINFPITVINCKYVFKQKSLTNGQRIVSFILLMNMYLELKTKKKKQNSTKVKNSFKIVFYFSKFLIKFESKSYNFLKNRKPHK